MMICESLHARRQSHRPSDFHDIHGERILYMLSLGISLLFFSILFVGTIRNIVWELGYAIPW
ncbi:MAG: hypothetical protein QGG26_02615 [Candidatus Undinarchaeales archaeon]|nr:hypothetical protein [Candidatus Undinarchaeales archaeon]